MVVNLESLDELGVFFDDSDCVSFFNNLSCLVNVPFSRDFKGLLGVYPELSRFGDLYFFSPFEFLDNVNTLRDYLLSGESQFFDGFYEERLLVDNFDRVFKENFFCVADFYNSLFSEVKGFSLENKIKPVHVLGDVEVFRYINRKLGVSKFKNMRESYWDIFDSLVKVLPEDVSDFKTFFDDLFVLQAEAESVMVGYASKHRSVKGFVYPRLEDRAEQLFLCKKSSGVDLSEGLRFFKSGYHDRVTSYFVVSFF